MRIAAIVGSIRQESYNLKLAKHVQSRYKDRFELDIVPIKELPFFSQDIESDPPEAVKQFRARIAEADAVLWLIPEYNGTIPGVLGNAIDWLSRGDKVMNGRPSWIMGTSPGVLGTVKAQLHLRDILFSMGINSPLLPGNEVYIGLAMEKFDDQGLVHEPTILFLDKVTDNFLNWYAKYHDRSSK